MVTIISCSTQVLSSAPSRAFRVPLRSAAFDHTKLSKMSVMRVGHLREGIKYLFSGKKFKPIIFDRHGIIYVPSSSPVSLGMLERKGVT